MPIEFNSGGAMYLKAEAVRAFIVLAPHSDSHGLLWRILPMRIPDNERETAQWQNGWFFIVRNYCPLAIAAQLSITFETGRIFGLSDRDSICLKGRCVCCADPRIKVTRFDWDELFAIAWPGFHLLGRYEETAVSD